MRIGLDINSDIEERLISYAAMNGFYRVDPRKSWRDRERREAIRFAIQKLILIGLAK